MKHSLKERIWRRLAAYVENSEFWQRFIARILMNSATLPAKIYPYTETEDVWWTEMPAPGAGSGAAGLPMPPMELREGYGKTDAEYLESGKQHVARMLEILAASGFSLEQSRRILDFGCSAGRMIRWLAPYAEEREIWGVDIASKPIHWATQHCSPPFFFATNTTLPPLPFESGTFDLIYCGSVFTHIADLAEIWLLELKRLLKPGGFLYATVHDKHTIDLLLTQFSTTALSRGLVRAGEKTGCLKGNFAKLVFARSPKGAQVFYDLEHLRRHWGRHFEFVSVVEEAYGYQTALILKKK